MPGRPTPTGTTPEATGPQDGGTSPLPVAGGHSRRAAPIRQAVPPGRNGETDRAGRTATGSAEHPPRTPTPMASHSRLADWGQVRPDLTTEHLGGQGSGRTGWEPDDQRPRARGSGAGGRREEAGHTGRGPSPRPARFPAPTPNPTGHPVRPWGHEPSRPLPRRHHPRHRLLGLRSHHARRGRPDLARGEGVGRPPRGVADSREGSISV